MFPALDISAHEAIEVARTSGRAYVARLGAAHRCGGDSSSVCLSPASYPSYYIGPRGRWSADQQRNVRSETFYNLAHTVAGHQTLSGTGFICPVLPNGATEGSRAKR